jgi:biopolymer transport protein ExbB
MEKVVNIMNLLTFGQAAPESAVEINSIFDFVVKGGPLMIPIGICSLIALTVIIERLITLRRKAVIPPQFAPGLKAILAGGRENTKQAIEYCRSNTSATAAILGEAIKRMHEPVELREKHIQEAGEREAQTLRKRLRMLSVIGSIAPLLGLLGTITGMITAFQTVAASGEALGRTELLAEGIYEAMITTAAGLIVAIPILVSYHWLAAKVDGLVMQIDRMTIEFMEEVASASSPSVTHGRMVERKPLEQSELVEV